MTGLGGRLGDTPAQALDWLCLIDGCLEIAQAGDAAWLVWAQQLWDRFDELFSSDKGVWYDHDGSDETVLYAEEIGHDGAEPSVLSLALQQAWTLGVLTAETKYHARMDQALTAVAPHLAKQAVGLSGSCIASVLYHADWRRCLVTGWAGSYNEQLLPAHDELSEQPTVPIPLAAAPPVDAGQGERSFPANRQPVIGMTK